MERIKNLPHLSKLEDRNLLSQPRLLKNPICLLEENFNYRSNADTKWIRLTHQSIHLYLQLFFQNQDRWNYLLSPCLIKLKMNRLDIVREINLSYLMLNQKSQNLNLVSSLSNYHKMSTLRLLKKTFSNKKVRDKWLQFLQLLKISVWALIFLRVIHRTKMMIDIVFTNTWTLTK